MANSKDLARIKRGVKEWNEWRSKKYQIIPDLRGADLSEADLRGVDFRGADLKGANLSRANLSWANLSWANLSRANLSRAILSRTQALKTNLEGATFTGAYIEDWNISSQTNLNNVICDYVYLKEDEQERRPHDPNKNFAPGEFTKLFQKALETVDLIFSDGIDWKAFLSSFGELQVKYGKQNLSVQAIEQKSDNAFVIRLNVPSDADKAEIESQAQELYETKLKDLEARYRAELNAKDEQIAAYHQYNTNLIEIIKLKASQPIQNIITVTATAESESTMSETYKSKYDLSQAKVGGIVDTAQTGSHQEFYQHNYAPEQKQTLAEAAAEIQKLLTQLQSQGFNSEEAQQKAANDLATKAKNDSTTKEKLVKWGQSLGDTAAQTTISEAAKEVVKLALRLSGVPLP